MKTILILKATKDICGSELGLIENHCKLLGMTVITEQVDSKEGLINVFIKLQKKGINVDYIYLCTHGNKEGFKIDTGKFEEIVPWAILSQITCEHDILHDDTIFLLACCKGGLFQVATDIMACCVKVNFVCGVKWNVEAWDLTTGFVVFLHNIENKRAEPSYAATKASLATDYTFVCYDRDEIEINPQFEARKNQLFQELGWTDEDNIWIETDPVIMANTGVSPKPSKASTDNNPN